MALPTDDVNEIPFDTTAEAPAAPVPPAPPSATAEAPAAPVPPAPPAATAEAPAAPVPPAHTTGQVTANAQATTAMAATPSEAKVQQAAAMGFEGLDFDGFGAYPIISLKNSGVFRTSDGWDLPDPFYAVILGSRKKFIYKNGLPDEDPDSSFFYTYDDKFSMSGESVEGILQTWGQKGWMPNKKPYLDVALRIVGGEHDGEAAILSVSKASISRFSAHWDNMMADGRPFSEIVTKIGKAPLVKVNRFEFYPISFSIYREGLV